VVTTALHRCLPWARWLQSDLSRPICWACTPSPFIYTVVSKLLRRVHFSCHTTVMTNRAIGCSCFKFGRHSSTFRGNLFCFVPCSILFCIAGKFFPGYSVSNVWRRKSESTVFLPIHFSFPPCYTPHHSHPPLLSHIFMVKLLSPAITY